jgi:YHS domain-containing protein
MKKAFLAMTIAIIGLGLVSRAAEEKPAAKAKPYLLKTCVVSDEKLGGEMGDPYVFTYEGREVKLCCKSCLKDFNKEPAKYVKKIEAAEKKK